MRRLWGFTVRLETWEEDARVENVAECAAWFPQAERSRGRSAVAGLTVLIPHAAAL